MTGRERGAIHPTALVSESAHLGDDVSIGAYCIVHDNVVVDEGTVVGSHCILGEPTSAYYDDSRYENPVCRIGRDSIVRSGTIVYAGARLGAYLQTGHRATIREGTVAGEHCSLGTNSELQGFCTLGDYVRLHSSVHVGQGCSIGSYVWVFPSTILLNDPQPPSERIVGATIDDFAIVAAGAILFPGVRVGESSLVAAGAVVRIDVPAGTIAAGDPARILGRTTSIPAWDAPGSAYPWPRHFSRGMPWEAIGYAEWARQHTGEGRGTNKASSGPSSSTPDRAVHRA